MSIIPFQFVVVMLPVLSHHFLPGRQLSNSMLGLYQATTVLTLFVILKVGSLHKCLLNGGLAIELICMAMFAPAFFYGSMTSRILVLHIIMGSLGIANALLQAAGFARAAILPRNYVGTTSVGQAAAGLVSFIVHGILTEWVYDMDNKEEAKWATSISCGIVVLLCIFSLIYMRFFLNARVSVKSVKDALSAGYDCKKGQDDCPTTSEDIEHLGKTQSSAEDETLLAPRPWMVMMKSSFWELTSVFLVFFVTFSLFPSVGPVAFNFEGKGPEKMVLLFGMHFIGDFLGRCSVKLPRLHPMLGFFFLSRNATIAGSFLRLVFYIPFVLAAKMEGTPFNNYAWLMILQFLLAFTLGWIGTLALIHCSLSVIRLYEKARMGSLSTIVLSIAIGMGLYIAMAY